MRYHEAAGFLLDLRRFRSKPGTASTAALLAALGDPHEGPAYVQVAGSNGKGSTARMLESVCRAAGLDVGLYTSPHLEDLRERITVDGRRIPEGEVTAFVEAAREVIRDRAADGEAPTFFETLTALALWHFGREDVDVAVLEVGIGGRLDATSVVDPVASAVTSVSLEHTDLLGDTVPEIARDKATVAPEDAPLVTGATGPALEAVREVAGAVHTVGGPDADVHAVHEGHDGVESRVSLEGRDWAVQTRVPLRGTVQATNAGVAAALARQVASVEEATLARGLRNAFWPGRVEVMTREPTVVLDGAHNPAACAALTDAVGDLGEGGRTHLVVGAMHDKDHAGMAAALPDAATVTVCRADIDRAADPAVLRRAFAGGPAETHTVAAVPDAVATALQRAAPEDLVLVTGSLSVVAEARPRWTRLDVPVRVETPADADRVLTGADVDAATATRTREETVSRTVRTRARPRQARALAAEFRALGGTAAVSAVADGHDEPVGLVLSGTVTRFRALADRLADRGLGLAGLAADLRDRADPAVDPVADAGAAVGERYPWSEGTAVMGILNITPDSFHDGGEYNAVADAVERAEAMVAAGVDILDVGGESTRPGADPVTVAEERERVVPVVEALSGLDALVSVDTRKAAVAEAALEAGADILNDVSGLEDPEMRFLAAEHDVPVVVMHSIDAPVDPTTQPDYDDVVANVVAELVEPVRRARQVGLDPDQVIVDPGVGFGKTGPESFELLDRLGELAALDAPVLVGHSHKSLFETVGYGPDEREHATVAATALAAERGADIVRVHDVPENVAAVRTVEAANRGDDGA